MRTIRENAHDQSIGNGFFSTIEVVERAAGRVIDDLFCSASRNVAETFALDDPRPVIDRPFTTQRGRKCPRRAKMPATSKNARLHESDQASEKA